MTSWIHEIRRHRGLIRLLRLELLEHIQDERIADPLLRARLIAEITMRGWLLAGGTPWESLHERLLIHSAWAKYGLSAEIRGVLEQWLASQYQHRSYELPSLCGVPECLLTMLQKDLGDWACADGAFPLVARDDSDHLARCTLLPFNVDKIPYILGAGVRTMSGESVTGLRSSADQALRVLRQFQLYKESEYLRVTLISLASPGVLIAGQSMGLPILIAEYLKQLHCRPRCLALSSSGCLAENGQLDRDLSLSASLSLKADWMKRCGVCVRIFPDDAIEAVDGTTWPVSRPLGEYLSSLATLKVSDIHVAFTDVIRSAQEVEERLNKINSGMRFGRIEASHAYRELKNISILLNAKVDAKSQRLCLYCDELRATALCHMGRTKESTDLTRRVIKQGGEVGVYYVAEALVRQAVNMTDFADYARAVIYCGEAISLLPEIRTPDERLDLQLKAISSKAQALTYWSLIDKVYLNESLALTKRAVDLATELDGDYPDNPERNLPRNLTYLHGWYALHRPLEAESVCRDVADAVLADPHSAAYFMRNRWLSAYRAYLNGNDLDWLSFEDELPDEKTEWLWSLSLKYRGAVRMGAGKINTASEDFSRAVLLLKQIDLNPLLAFIGATVALQAAESLKNIDVEQSARYATAALPVIDTFNGWFKADELDASKWRSRAAALLGRQPLKGIPHPQLHYLF